MKRYFSLLYLVYAWILYHGIVIIQKITKIKPKSKEDKWPKMRLGHHAACCLDFNTKSPQLLISGGRIKHELPPKDIWILNLPAQEWNQVCTQHTNLNA